MVVTAHRLSEQEVRGSNLGEGEGIIYLIILTKLVISLKKHCYVL